MHIYSVSVNMVHIIVRGGQFEQINCLLVLLVENLLTAQSNAAARIVLLNLVKSLL